MCAPTVALIAKDPAAALVLKLAANGIMIGNGDFYGVHCSKTQGVDVDHGALRVSFVHYTSEAEVAKLMDGLDEVL